MTQFLKVNSDSETETGLGHANMACPPRLFLLQTLNIPSHLAGHSLNYQSRWPISLGSSPGCGQNANTNICTILRIHTDLQGSAQSPEARAAKP